MVAVITGDVINSRSLNPDIWLDIIKSILKRNKIPSKKWEIFRGDMLQIELDSGKVLSLALELKAAIKEHKDLDLRMSIGIGAINYEASNVIESNGEAYILSGKGFERLKNRTLTIETPWKEFNKRWKVILDLCLMTMNNWTPGSAHLFKSSLQFPGLTQKEIAKKMNRSQSTISEGLSRSGHSEISAMMELFEEEIKVKLE